MFHTPPGTVANCPIITSRIKNGGLSGIAHFMHVGQHVKIASLPVWTMEARDFRITLITCTLDARLRDSQSIYQFEDITTLSKLATFTFTL